MARILLCALIVLLLFAPPASAQDFLGSCAETTIDPLAPPPAGELRVVVLTDGPSLPRAREVVATAATYYEPVGLELTAVYQELGGATTGDASALMSLARSAVGQAIGVWAHAAVVLTDRDLRDGTADANGVADCIGGIAEPEHAFATVQNFADETPGLGPLDNTENQTAKVFAHELGHLLAARHEHHNCVENAPDEPEQVTPCTLMFPSGGMWGHRFGVLETRVIRSFAAEYVKPLQPVPSPAETATEPAPGAAPAPAAGPRPAAEPTPSSRCRRARVAVRRARRALAQRRGRARRAAKARLRRAERTARKACD